MPASSRRSFVRMGAAPIDAVTILSRRVRAAACMDTFADNRPPSGSKTYGQISHETCPGDFRSQTRLKDAFRPENWMLLQWYSGPLA